MRNLTRHLLVAFVSIVLLPIGASGQLQGGDLFIGIGGYPPFDAGESFGAIRLMRGGSLSDPIDSYTTGSQGPHDLVNELWLAGDQLVFDRDGGVAFLEGARLIEWQLSRRVSAFVRDRQGRLYVASSYGAPLFEKFDASGESVWITTLPGVRQGQELSLDLAEDQCTLWYSERFASGVFVFDVCRQLYKGTVGVSAAREIRFLRGGTALLATESGIVRVDRTGSVITEVPYHLPYNIECVSMSVAEDQATVWVAEGARYTGANIVYQLTLPGLELVREYTISRNEGTVSAIAIVPDWRAGTAPAVRRRPIRRSAAAEGAPRKFQRP